jgi:hypothetical protein
MTRLRRLPGWLLTASIAVASLRCGSDIGDPGNQPAALDEVGGNGQVGIINETLPEPLVVQVEDEAGSPLEGVSVRWTVGGGGSVSAAQVVTGADGRASVTRTLGAVAGEQTTTASVEDLPAVVFTSTAEAGAVPQLLVATQPSPAAVSGATLAQQPVIQLEDGTGQPGGAGVEVTATVNGATLAGTTTAVSDDAGVARFVDLALSGPDGTYTLVFEAEGYVGVQSNGIALSGTPVESGRLVIVTQPSPEADNGEALARQPVVRAEDADGNPLPAGVPVTVAAQGATVIGTTTVESDEAGLASFTDLALTGPSGNYRLAFSAPDLTGVESNQVALTTTGAESGQWTEVLPWPIVAIHTMLLPSGKVLAINRIQTPQIWDPATDEFTAVPAPANLFCAGHTLLPDGRVFLAGGHIDDNMGLPNITTFSPVTEQWTSFAPMQRGRWYPTTTVMGNGDVVILAGRDQDAVEVTIPEVWSDGSLRQLPGADRALPYYPRAFLTPNGRVYVAGPANVTRFLDISGNGAWTNGPTRLGGSREYGSAVMYDDGKILYAGGNRTTNTAETIDLNAASPQWQWTSPMAFARRHLNLTVLPTGEVLATGGVAGTTFNDVSAGVRATELWDPDTGTWTTLASSSVTRGYHASSLLLPDGRVLHAGSGEGAGAPDQKNAQIFTPPYLLRGARPDVTGLPDEVGYGATFRVETPQAGEIVKVSFIRLGATTHAFDENQRFQRLTFTADATGLSVTAPSSSNRAPPGHYLVFILNAADVPSVGRIVRLR